MRSVRTLALCTVLTPGCFSPNAKLGVDDDDTGTGTDSHGHDDTTGVSNSTAADSQHDVDSTGNDSNATLTGDDTDPDDGTTTTGCSSHDECSDPAPFCNRGTCVSCADADDPDAACGELSTDQPVCSEAGECVTCTTTNAGACTGSTPACTDDYACAPCTEHFHCPETACHLAGPDKGSCFSLVDVRNASTTLQLNNHLSGLGQGDQRVIKLAAGSYNGPFTIGGGAEVAILGPSNAILTLTSGNSLLTVNDNAIGYLAGVTAVGIVGSSGIGCTANANSFWVDDVEVREFQASALLLTGFGLAALCETHVRRATVRANSSGALVYGGTLFVESSAFGGNTGQTGNDVHAGIVIEGGELFATYSTFAGNNLRAINCLGASGHVRNSILVGRSGSSVPALATSCVSDLDLDYNAVYVGSGPSPGSSNKTIATSYSADWFVSPAVGNYRLASAGETLFADTAQWQPGDPLRDVDGNSISTVQASHPGYHQP